MKNSSGEFTSGVFLSIVISKYFNRLNFKQKEIIDNLIFYEKGELTGPIIIEGPTEIDDVDNDEYFLEIINKHGEIIWQYLSFDEPIIFIKLSLQS